MTKPIAEACLRNQQPIAEVLQGLLLDPCTVLELGSGTGQHGVFCAQRLPHVQWQPTELEENLAGINLWRDEAGLDNMLAPLMLDLDQPWPIDKADHIFTANTVHYVALATVKNMFAKAARVLPSKGLFIIYGPVNENGKFTSEGNARLDEWLKTCVNRLAGIKDLDQIIALADLQGLSLIENLAMPANNRLLVFQKQ
jgi:cyclopropane fatty-acyl-phospholipid synthase-like methyltransferase